MPVLSYEPFSSVPAEMCYWNVTFQPESLRYTIFVESSEGEPYL